MQHGLSTVFVCRVCFSKQQSCKLHLSFCVCKGCRRSHCVTRWPVPTLQSKAVGHLFAAAPPNAPWLTLPPPPWRTNSPARLLLPFLHLHTTRHPSPSVTIYSPAQPRFVLPIHPHLHPLSHFPKPTNTFLATHLALFFFSLGCFKPRVQAQNPYRSNLPCQSLSTLFSVPVSHFKTHTRAHTHTPIWNSYQLLYKCNTPFSNPDTFTQKNARTHGPHRHTHTHTHTHTRAHTHTHR